MQATGRAAAAFDGEGRLLCLNSLAEARVGDLFDVAQGALAFCDRASQFRFDALLALALRGNRAAEPKPIAQSVRNRARGSVVIQAIGLLGGRKYLPRMRKCSFCSAIRTLRAKTYRAF